MRYRKKSEIIEAVKWDGKLETIKNNKWLEDAIKEDKIILGMNDIYDKEPVLLIENKWSEEFRQVDLGTYLIKVYDKNKIEEYEIGVMDSEDFESKFELINESSSEVSKGSINIKVDLDAEEAMKSISKANEEVKSYKETRMNSFEVITKDVFILRHLTRQKTSSKEEIEKIWNDISQGYNFILTVNDDYYYSVDYINNLLSK